MTSAPPRLMEIREYLIDHFNVDGEKVGIVGNPDHLGGYHCGRDRTVTNDYSVIESDRDRKGLSDYASALDIGTFNNGPMNLRHFTLWLVDRCKRGTLDTGNIREVIYTPDGKNVLRWDRLKKRKTGDSSHLYHTHISYFRDSSNSTKNLALFQLYVKEMTSEMELNDTVNLTAGQKEMLADDPGVQDGIAVNTALGGSYAFSRVANRKLDALSDKIDAIKPVVYVQLTDTQFEEWFSRTDNGE